MISAELPRVGEDDKIRELLRKYNTYRHSAYFRRNKKCLFGYESMEVLPSTTIDMTLNRVMYRRIMNNDFKVVT